MKMMHYYKVSDIEITLSLEGDWALDEKRDVEDLL